GQVARHLHCRGVTPGELVGLSVERSLEQIIAVLGILKAGGAYWALEENLPENRLQLMLADARPRLLLTRRDSGMPLSRAIENLPVASSLGAIKTVPIEDLLEPPPGGMPWTNVATRADAPAYVSYTSGSTGQPKGVVVPHRGVVRLVKNTNYASLGTTETLL